MIEFEKVWKHFGTQDVLKDASMKILPGERMGIVGPNGAGKSTVFGLINGELESDKGDVLLPKGIRVGHLRQQLHSYSVEQTLVDYAMAADPRLKEIEAEMERLSHLLDSEDKEKVALKLGDLETEYGHRGGYDIKQRSEANLCGLGFAVDDLERPFQEFSGGWQMRAELVRVLVGNPDVLLLDEPSNYLDLPAVEWLTRYLRNFEGTLLLISHDRHLLKSLATRIVEVNAGELTRYQGDYDYYIRERDARMEQRIAQKKNQDRKREEIERFIERFRAKNTKASQVQSRQKMLEKMEDIEIPNQMVSRNWITLAEPPHCGNEVIRLEGIGKTYEDDQWVLRGIDLSIEKGSKISLIGFNGMGKTTLLRMIAGTLAPSEGKRVLGHQVKMGYQSQEFAETMDPEATVYGIIKEAAPPECTSSDIRSLLGGFGFSGDDIDKRVKIISGGEKIRLAFARIFVDPPNLLILDEPTTHLDLDGRAALEQALVGYSGTVIIVSHDITFVRAVSQAIIAITPPGITMYHGDYDYYREKVGSDYKTAIPASPKEKTEKLDKKARQAARKEEIKHKRQMEKLLGKAEESIEELEAEQMSLTESLGEADADYATINARLSEIQTEIDEWTAKWDEAAEYLA